MFSFLKIKLPPRVPRKPDVFAIYDCAFCGERFKRDPDEWTYTGNEDTRTLLGHKAFATVVHGCSAHIQGVGRLVGMQVAV